MNKNFYVRISPWSLPFQSSIILLDYQGNFFLDMKLKIYFFVLDGQLKVPNFDTKTANNLTYEPTCRYCNLLLKSL